jgi:hypothetical protein
MVNVIERAKRWEAFAGSWSQFLRAESPKFEDDYTKALAKAKFKNQSPEFHAYQNACQRIWTRKRRRRSKTDYDEKP